MTGEAAGSQQRKFCKLETQSGAGCVSETEGEQSFVQGCPCPISWCSHGDVQPCWSVQRSHWEHRVQLSPAHVFPSFNTLLLDSPLPNSPKCSLGTDPGPCKPFKGNRMKPWEILNKGPCKLSKADLRPVLVSCKTLSTEPVALSREKVSEPLEQPR